ncbi:MAG: FkbM family methyltransferase [Proteobacteria bacterium]|nr:FkbM family methyltransferase [Pseudomonadota bacterium]
MLFRKPKPHKTRAGKIVLTLNAHGIDTVLDIGANVGQTGRELREHGYKGRIISFEPVPSAHAQLLKAAAKDPFWEVAPRTAVGAKTGEVLLHESESSDMSSVRAPEPALMEALPKTHVVGEHPTPICTVADIVAKYCPDSARIFVKVDTQGYEKQVLEGFAEAWPRILGIQMEMSLFSLYTGEALFMELTKRIMDEGFEPHLMLETTFSRRLNRQLQVDGVFYRPSAK